MNDLKKIIITVKSRYNELLENYYLNY